MSGLEVGRRRAPGRARVLPTRRQAGSLLRLALIVALVPVVVLVQSGAARAAEATAYSSWKSVTGGSDRLIDLIKGVDYLRVECSFVARYVVTSTTQSVEVRDGKCDSFSVSFKAGKPYTLTMRGFTSTGAPCEGSVSGTFGGDSAYLGVHIRTTFAATVPIEPVMGPQLAPGCSLDSFTLNAPGNSIWDGNVDVLGTLNLGPVPSVTQQTTNNTNGNACAYGQGFVVVVSCNASAVTYRIRKDALDAALSRTGEGGAKPHVQLRLVERTFNNTTTSLTWYHKASPFPDPYVNTVSVATTRVRDFELAFNFINASNQQTLDPYAGRLVVGQNGTGLVPPTNSDPYGTTEPVVDGDGLETDQPEAAPVDQRDGCGFSWSDPSTYASAGICQIVSVLTRIWETLKGIPGAIVGGIRDVFVPGAGVLEAELGQIKTAWSGTAPFALADAVGQIPGWLVEPAGGGCQGLALGPISFGMGTTPHTFRPFSTCASERAQLANVVRIGLMVMVYVGAGLAALRIVGSSLGVDLSIGKGDDA